MFYQDYFQDVTRHTIGERNQFEVTVSASVTCSFKKEKLFRIHNYKWIYFMDMELMIHKSILILSVTTLCVNYRFYSIQFMLLSA